jgi:hypothetical protein
MKKIIAIITLLAFSLIGFSQVQLTNNASYNFAGTAADTIKKDTYKYYKYTATPYVKQISLQATATRSTGNYTKAYVVIEKSFDGVKYFGVDSVLLAGTGAIIKGKIDIKSVYANQIRIKAYGIDSTQKSVIKVFTINDLK